MCEAGELDGRQRPTRNAQRSVVPVVPDQSLFVSPTLARSSDEFGLNVQVYVQV